VGEEEAEKFDATPFPQNRGGVARGWKERRKGAKERGLRDRYERTPHRVLRQTNRCTVTKETPILRGRRINDQVPVSPSIQATSKGRDFSHKWEGKAKGITIEAAGYQRGERVFLTMV